MAATKKYGSANDYENKLSRVMERLGAESFNYNWDRFGGWVDFCYKGELYRFEHSIDKAKSRGIDLKFGSDAFAQVVLSLEDIARMVERGIYDLQSWISGMKLLPPVVEVPSFFKFMGYTSIPADASEVKDRYRTLAKQMHPDAGGKQEDFIKLQEASELSMKYFSAVK